MDKKVPIALIMALLLQGAVALSWANYISADVQQLKTSVAELKSDNKKAVEKFETLIELRTDVRNLVASIARLEALVEKKTK